MAEEKAMKCPTCDHTMHGLGIKIAWAPIFWCQRCGTLEEGKDVNVPTFVHASNAQALIVAEAEVREVGNLVYDLQQEVAEPIELGAAKERGALLAKLYAMLEVQGQAFDSEQAVLMLRVLVAWVTGRGKVLAPFWPERLAEENRELKAAAKDLMRLLLEESPAKFQHNYQIKEMGRLLDRLSEDRRH